jgi:hypothetical protein
MKYLLIILFSFSLSSFAQDLSQEEKELESINFNELKNVLQDDFLEPEVESKVQEVKQIKKKKKKRKINKYNYPRQEDFWSFMTEYWLVKNASLLKWDFKKPNYGLNSAVEKLFEKIGLYQIEFQVLPINTPSLTHFSLPGDNGKYTYLLSVPFMRTLDLTKTEIALLVLEDYFRQKLGFFHANIKDKQYEKFLGKNFYNKKINLKVFDDLLAAYTRISFESGYTFQQQFEVTKKMDIMLKTYPKLWSTYFQLLLKIDKLVKSNSSYKNYNKIFPSPEMQMKWLSPKEKIL